MNAKSLPNVRMKFLMFWLLHLTLVHINGLALANLLHVDEIQQIFVLEHHHSLAGQIGIGKYTHEVVGQCFLMLESIRLDQCFHLFDKCSCAVRRK